MTIPNINPYWEHVYGDVYRSTDKTFVVKRSGYRGAWTVVMSVPIDAEPDMFVLLVSKHAAVADVRKAFEDFLTADPAVVVNKVLEANVAKALTKSENLMEEAKRQIRVSKIYKELKLPTNS